MCWPLSRQSRTPSLLRVICLNTGSLDVKALAVSDQALSVVSGGEAHDAIVLLGTGFAFHVGVLQTSKRIKEHLCEFYHIVQFLQAFEDPRSRRRASESPRRLRINRHQTSSKTVRKIKENTKLFFTKCSTNFRPCLGPFLRLEPLHKGTQTWTQFSVCFWGR